jgi:hypothetical protein
MLHNNLNIKKNCIQLCASSDGPPWSPSGVVLHKFIADDEICDRQHNTQYVGCFFTFQVIVNNELNFSAQNTHFAQQEDSPVKMCYTLGFDATKGSTILSIIYRVTWQARDQSARHLNLNPDRPVCLSTLVAWGYFETCKIRCKIIIHLSKFSTNIWKGVKLGKIP